MAKSLNQYGDRMVKTTGQHGADISSQRMDELDVETMLYAIRQKDQKGCALDLGCGLGIQGLRLASLGFKTLLIDFLPAEQTVLKLTGLRDLLPLSYLNKDARQLNSADLPEEIAVCYSQRFIHYLTFQEAAALLKLVRARMPAGAKLFLSASGLLSELGKGYTGIDQPITTRFGRLATPIAEKHNIFQPVCLYTLEDLTVLCQSAAFLCDRVYSSAFGNAKGIFTAA